MKKTLVLFLGLLLISSLAFAQSPGEFKPGSEPDGWGGIKWGTDIRTLPNMEYYGTDKMMKEIQIYKKKNDELKIGGVNLEDVQYCFGRGKFCSIRIYTKGSNNYACLRDFVFAKFGKGYQKNENLYFWSGKTTGMILGYTKIIGIGNLFVFSEEMLSQLEK